MKTYSEQIVKAYNNWMDKTAKVPTETWQDNYKKFKSADKRAGDRFEKLCKIEGLNYIEVARDLMPTTLYI